MTTIVRTESGRVDRYDSDFIEETLEGSLLVCKDSRTVAIHARGTWESAKHEFDNHEDPLRAPQEWKYLFHIPHHIRVRDSAGLLWRHAHSGWFREDGRKATDDWTGPFTEVFDD